MKVRIAYSTFLAILMSFIIGCQPQEQEEKKPPTTSGSKSDPHKIVLETELQFKCGQYAEYTIPNKVGAYTSSDVFVNVTTPTDCKASLTFNKRNAASDTRTIPKGKMRVFMLSRATYSKIIFHCDGKSEEQCTCTIVIKNSRKFPTAAQEVIMSNIEIGCGEAIEIFEWLTPTQFDVEVSYKSVCSGGNKNQRNVTYTTLSRQKLGLKPLNVPFTAYDKKRMSFGRKKVQSTKGGTVKVSCNDGLSRGMCKVKISIKNLIPFK